MKKVLCLVSLYFMFTSSAFAGSVYVDGYYKSNGTYVAPYYRSEPDGIRGNNWSERPLNPYTNRRYKPDRYHIVPEKNTRDYRNNRSFKQEGKDKRFIH